MNEQLTRLTEKYVKAMNSAEEIRVKYDGSAESMSAEEAKSWKGWLDEADATRTQIDTLRQQEELKTWGAQLRPSLPLAGKSDTTDSVAAGPADRDGSPRGIKAMTPVEVKAWKSFWGGTRMGDMFPDAIKALSAQEGDLGGYLVVPQELSQRFLTTVKDAVYLRSMATVITMDKAESLGVPTLDNDFGDPTWTTELAVGPKDTVSPFGKRQIAPHPLAKEILISNKLLRQATLDPEAIVMDRLAYRVARAEENAFLNGSGAQQPLGVFTASTGGIDTSRDLASKTGGVLVGDDLIALKHFMKPQYWARMRAGLHRNILSAVRQLKDSQGNYVWQPGLAGYVAQGTALIGANPETIVGVPYFVSELAPTAVTGGQYSIVMGDFSFYWIVDALDMQVQRLTELYAEQNQTAFILRKETDGAPVLAEAFARLKH